MATTREVRSHDGGKTWGDWSVIASDLAGREGQPIRLRFRLRRAALYAYGWQSRNEGSQKEETYHDYAGTEVTDRTGRPGA